MKKATILTAVIIAVFVASCGNGTNSATAPTTDSTSTDSTVTDSAKTSEYNIPFHTPIN